MSRIPSSAVHRNHGNRETSLKLEQTWQVFFKILENINICPKSIIENNFNFNDPSNEYKSSIKCEKIIDVLEMVQIIGNNYPIQEQFHIKCK